MQNGEARSYCPSLLPHAIVLKLRARVTLLMGLCSTTCSVVHTGGSQQCSCRVPFQFLRMTCDPRISQKNSVFYCSTHDPAIFWESFNGQSISCGFVLFAAAAAAAACCCCCCCCCLLLLLLLLLLRVEFKYARVSIMILVVAPIIIS